MNTFVVADLHYGHSEILMHCRRKWCVPNLAYDPSLPYDFRTNNPLAVPQAALEAHDQALTDNWNATVSKKDRVIIVGDFAFKNHARHASMLHGRKILVMGNHDDMNREALKHFAEVYDFGCVKKMPAGSLKEDGRSVKNKITFCHYAMRAWPGSWEGTAALHGHSHGRMPELDILLSFDVGVDVWGYFPIPWEAIQRRIDDKRAVMGSRGPAENSDGRARGGYAPNPEDRVVETRKRNLAVLKAVGITVPDDHFSLSPACLKAIEAQKTADKTVSSVVAVAGAMNRHGRMYTRECLKQLADGSMFLWDEASGALILQCRSGLASNQDAVARLFRDRFATMIAVTTETKEATNGQVGGKTV